MPKRLTMIARTVGEPGAFSHYPFARLAPGDELFVPVRRAGKRAIDAAVRRWHHKHPEYHLTTQSVDAGTLIIRME